MLSALTPSPARRPARCRYKRNSLNAKYDRRIGALEGAGEAQARAAQLDVARRGVEHAVQQRQNKVLELFDVNAGVRGGNGPTLPFSKPNPVSYSEAKNRIIMGGSGPLRPESPLPDELDALLFRPVSPSWPSQWLQPAQPAFGYGAASYPLSPWYGEARSTGTRNQPGPTTCAPTHYAPDHWTQCAQPQHMPFGATSRHPDEQAYPLTPLAQSYIAQLIPSDSVFEQPYSSPTPARTSTAADMYFEPRRPLIRPHDAQLQQQPEPYWPTQYSARLEATDCAVPAALSEVHRSIVEHVMPPALPAPTTPPPPPPRKWPGKITALKSKSIIRSLEKQAADMSSSPLASPLSATPPVGELGAQADYAPDAAVFEYTNDFAPEERSHSPSEARIEQSHHEAIPVDSSPDYPLAGGHSPISPPYDSLDYHLQLASPGEDSDYVSEPTDSPERDEVPVDETWPAQGVHSACYAANDPSEKTEAAYEAMEEDFIEEVSSPECSASPPSPVFESPSNGPANLAARYAGEADWQDSSPDEYMDGMVNGPDDQPKSILRRPGSRASGNRVRWSKYTEVETIEVDTDGDSNEDDVDSIEETLHQASAEESGLLESDDSDGIFDAGDVPPLATATPSPTASLEGEHQADFPFPQGQDGSQTDDTSEIDENELEVSASFEEAMHIEDIEPPGELSQQRVTTTQSGMSDAPEPLDPDCLLPPGWPDAYETPASQSAEQNSITLEHGFFDAESGGMTGFKIWRDEY